MGKRIAALEGGAAALATASGQAAEILAITNLANAGEEIISTTSLYGGTYNLFHYTLPKYGITVRFADADDFDGIRAAINDKTRAIYTETLGNPSSTSPTSRPSPPSPTNTACRSSSTTPAPPHPSAAPSNGEPTSSSSQPPNISAATAPRSAESSSTPANSTGRPQAASRLHRTRSLLPRPLVSRCLRPAGLHPESPRSGPSRHRRGALALQRISVLAGC